MVTALVTCRGSKKNIIRDMVAAVAKKTREPSLGFIAFLQALGLFIYCALVALLFWRGNQWFGSVPNFFGPLLFLILFVTSALISALVTLGYPIILFGRSGREFKRSAWFYTLPVG